MLERHFNYTKRKFHKMHDAMNNYKARYDNNEATNKFNYRTQDTNQYGHKAR